MKLGLSSLSITAQGGPSVPIIITATIAPAMSTLRDGDSVNDVTNYSTMVSTGNYASTAGTISSAVVAFTGDAVSAGGALSEGDTAGFTVTVTDSVGNERVFNAGLTTVLAELGVTSLTTGNVGWAWSNNLDAGTDATGRAYVVKPSGSETFSQPTPAQVDDGGDVAGGVMKNPARTSASSQTQGFDERVNASNYDAAKNETSTIAMTAGDRLVKAVPASVGSYSDSREPIASEYQVLHCVASAPGSDDVLAPTVQYSGSSYPEKYTVNWTTLLAKFQNRSASGISLTLPSYTEVMAQLNKQAPMYAYNNATTSGSGYERLMPADFHGAIIDATQYGRYISQLMSVIAAGLHYDTWSSSEKTDILKKLVGLGVEWGFPLMDAGFEVGPDGGHNQFSQFPTIIALVACGREADVTTFFTDSGGGNWDGYFNVTNALIASDLSQHTSTARPILWYEQTLPAQPGGNVVRIPAASQVNNNQTEIPVGARVMRKGAFGGIHVATVTATKELASGATNDVAINAQPDTAFASSDVVWFEAPPVSVYDGAVDWIERSAFGPSGNSSSPERYTPSAGNEYRDLQAIAGAVAGVAGAGYLHEDMRAVWRYVERAHEANEPAFGNDYATTAENWENSTASYSLAPIFNSQTEREALGLAVSEYEASAPTALTIQHIAHPSATVSGSDDLIDGQVIGVVGDLTQQAVKIAGVATGGDKTPVQVRVIEDSDSSVVQDWTHLGWIDSGTFEGTIVLPIGSDWYNFEVRSLRDTGVTSTPTERVGVGHKIMVIGQSQARIWSTGNAATGLTMTSAYENTAMIYGWNASASIPEYSTVIDDSAPDGPRAFVEQARALGVTAPIQIVMETKNGTSIVDFLDDSDAGRDWSDLTDKTSKYGNDFTSVIEWWDTSNASPLDGDTDIETLFGIEDHTSGNVADHGLNEELLPGFKAIIQLASRHANAGADIGHAGAKVDYFNGSPKMPLTLGWPLADYETDGTGPHADIAAASNGNIYGGYRMALGHVEAMGGTSFTKSYLAGSAERNSAGTVITVPITLENGGTLGIEGSEVSGFEVSQDSGSTWTDRLDATHPFTATVSGSNVLITKDSGTWAANTSLQVRKQGRLEENPNTGFSASLETEIIEGELYETGVTNVKGPGLPVHGLNSGSWTYGAFATITSVSQEAAAGIIEFVDVNTSINPGSTAVTWTSAADEAARYLIGINSRENGNMPTSVTLAGATATALGSGVTSTGADDTLRFYEVTTTGSGNLVRNYSGNPIVSQAFLWKIPTGLSTAGLEEGTADEFATPELMDVVVTGVEDGDEMFVMFNRAGGGQATPTVDTGWSADALATADVGSSSHGAAGRHTKVGAGSHTATIDWNSGSSDRIGLMIALTPS